ncbi:response regulator [Mesorhizobium sp. B2-4-12]|uniref:response regulator n=1 Tax=unclassified Mesorhizobium TaxID=325217 RepID=UPI001127E4AC|nr:MULTISPECIES: response regulator [unclassified Mesorhizobium]TPK76104.1 response regulator [Mesorhizobium sp. B2-4-17]TPK98701.1 response regulator [Mesorhizobium sp. B2-4-12]
MTQLRILIVEDEWLIAEDHAAMLRAAGHLVVGPAASVKAAIDCMEGEEFDAALLDVQLSGEVSYGLADTLREKVIPFAFVTGYSPSEMPARFAGVQVLQKPVVPAVLIAAIMTLFDQQSAGKQEAG